jgi:hypothetical protein
MTELVLQCSPTATTSPCAVCGRPTAAPAGTRLCRADRTGPVCPDCGRRHAPALAALVSLASAAERVGRIGRHTVFPPLTALLDLARAAENYTATAPAARPLHAAAAPAALGRG